ncbi:hypothetical protein J6590_072839 [Homalodisca vitripennis]|nr:hypothetical protein J6590_072839 [Homalodisca vitripennis]
MDILNEERRRLKSQPEQTAPLVDLERENVSSKPQVVASVDLTEAESEIIVLDETLNQLNTTLSNLDVTLGAFDDVVYLGTINPSKSPRNQMKNSESDVKIVNSMNIRQDKLSNKNNVYSSNLVTPDKINSMLRKSKLRRKSKINKMLNSTLTAKNKKLRTSKKTKRSRTSSSQSITDVSMDNLLNEDMPPTKKRKFKKINIKSITATPPSKPLPGNILKYYAKIESAFDKIKNSDKKKKKCKNLTPASKLNKRKQDIKKKTKLNDVGKKKNKKLSPQKRMAVHEDCIKVRREANIFNPNPIDIDKEGLRPIIIDGCNVAIGHGRGKFSVKGLQICVDYFVNRGHNHIKVFLPRHRQAHFKEEELSLLERKCDVVFTPSRKVNGVIKTSYDDRSVLYLVLYI